MRSSETSCPFCGVEQRFSEHSALAGMGAGVGAFALLALSLLGTTACSKPAPGDGAGDGTDGTSDGTSDGSSTTVGDSSDTGTSDTSTDTNDSADDMGDPSGSFYAGSDGGDVTGVGTCDPWVQDCPEGEKCVPYASEGGTWNANKCVPVTGDGQVGEACTYGGVVDATDDCDEASVCWNVREVDGAPVGECTAFCEGSPDEPECAEGAVCVIANEGSVSVCLQSCDPLAQDCPEGFGCYAGAGQDEFVCVFEGANEPSGACGFLNDCPPGSACVNAEVLPACDAAACCTAYCSLTEPDCAEPGTECVPFFAEGLAPAGYEDVGICGLG